MPRVDDPATSTRCATSSQLHDVRLIVPLTDLDHLHARAGAGRARRRRRARARRRDDRALLRQVPRARASSTSRGSARRRRGCPTELPERRPLPGARQGAQGLRLAPHLPRRRTQTELDFFLRYTTADSMVQAVCRGEEFSIDVFCDLDARCLAAIPRTMIESKGGESIKGMTIKDAELIEFGARGRPRRCAIIGPANVQCFREPDGELQVTDVNPRFGGGFPLPTAAGSRYPELALALANGEQPEPRLGDFREGVVMTRFFSQVILEERDGTLEPVPRRRRRCPRRREEARACSSPERCCSRGCGSRHEAAPPPTATATNPAPRCAGRRSGTRSPPADRRPGDGRRRRHEPPRPRRARHDRRALGAQRPPRRRARPARCTARRSSRPPTKPGYGERAVRLSFRTHPKSTIRIYRRSLQWAMYGADPQRTQAHDDISVRPPFRVVWSRGLGDADRVSRPSSRTAWRTSRTRRARSARLDMRNGDIVWRHDTPHGKMAASPAVWGDQLIVHGMDGHVWVLRRSDGKLLWHYTVGSPVESSPVDRRRRRRLRRLERDDHRARPADAQGALAALRRLQDHLVRRARGLDALHRRLLRPAARAATRATARLRWSRSVNGRVYGTPAVAAGRVFVPSSTGGSLTAFSTARALSLAPQHRLVRLLVARGRARAASSSARTTASSTACSARTGATLWSHGTGGPISGAATVVDGVAYAGSFAHRILGVDARSGRVVLELPAR